MEREFYTIDEVTEWYDNEIKKLNEKKLSAAEYFIEVQKLDKQSEIYVNEARKKMNDLFEKCYGI